MNRLYRIVVILLESKEAISTNSIANQLSVSEKTVRNDMKKLEDILGKEGLTLVKKTGVGNYIDGPKDNKRLFLHTLRKELEYIEPFSLEGRQNYILRSLFMNSDEVTVSKLADEMYVSMTTVYKDLKQVEEVLAPFHLEIIKSNDHTLRLKGDEKHYRIAISTLVFQGMEEAEAEVYKEEAASRIDQGTKRQLDQLMDIDYLILEKHIIELEKKLEFEFTQEAYICLVIHIAIAIKRIKGGKDILLTNETLENLKKTKEFKIAKQMSRSIGLSYQIEIPEQEIGYITLHILGSKIGREDLESLEYDMDSIKEMEDAVEIAHKIIAIASDTLNTNLKEDLILLNGLILHLRPTINRLKYGLPLRNPILEEIKSNYPDIFGVAWICGKVLKKYFDVVVPESEIGYIALHIGASLERNRSKIKALVVCHSGIGTSQLLSARLKRCFKELDIVGIVSSINLREDVLDKADIIISTIPLNLNIDKPIFMISPLFTSDDVKKVEWLIEKYQNKESFKNKSVMGKEVFIRTKCFDDKDDLISDICGSLYQRNYIYKSYEKSVKDREKIYSTEVGRGIAIPHGSPSEVKKSCISVTILKHPMKWEQEKVEFVFLISLKDEDLKYARTIFRNLSDEMEKDEFKNMLRSGQEEALKVLDGLLCERI